MKEIIKDSFKKLFDDKYLLSLVALMAILALFCSVVIGLSVNPRDLLLPSHYSAYGFTHFYFDQWFYLLVFVVFGIIVAALHSLLSVKLLIVKGHSHAVFFAWVGIGVIILGLITAFAVINVQDLL